MPDITFLETFLMLQKGFPCYIRFNPVPMTSTEIRSTYIKTV